ncbi:MAG: DUF4932 domain-containing protein [Bacteroidota bacterium]
MNRSAITRFISSTLFFLYAFSLAGQDLPFIKATSNSAVVRLNKSSRTNRWGISPETKPDVYIASCVPGKKTRVTFITDLDSITFNVVVGDSVFFNIILNEKDTALTCINGKAIPEAAVFSKKYIKKSKGLVSVQVPEVKELLQVIFAITPTGLADVKSFIINHDTTAYYLKVIDHFLLFKNEPVVRVMDSLLMKGQYINLKMDACAFIFTGDNIVFGDTYNRYNNSGSSVNLAEPYIQLLKDFAVKTSFRKFYAGNKPYYDSLIQVYQKWVPVRKMWQWCEQQFPSRYQSYRVYFSPLVKGNHATSHAENNGFKETNMFIRPALALPQVNEKVREALNSRIVFTEIDHNYVNPETDRYLQRVNRIFNKRNIWADGKESNGYSDPYNLFNEYMTWALYVLYCREIYAPEDFKFVQDNTANYLIKIRGFPKFMEFTDALLSLYSTRPAGMTVAGLYPQLLDWCEKQN